MPSDVEQRVASDQDAKDAERRFTTKSGYPKSVAFIIGNEFCERFSYYGMRAVLTLYFIRVLSYSENEATEAFHTFTMAAYFTPVIGAIIADTLLGKFRTIFYISLIYVAGNIALSYASWQEDRFSSILGLILIAFGTGGIKPCVAAFGGDQFLAHQTVQLQQFFSIFYMSINAGSLISMFVTPIFREDVNCSHRGDCFPLAFGMPAILMVIALVLFVAGKSLYRIVPPAKGNIVFSVVGCIFYALYKKLTRCCGSGPGPARSHWLDNSADRFDPKLISDVKALLRVLFLYIPLPLFWALYDQQGSRWTLQATKMDGDFFGFYRVKPDQIQVINPVLIIIMIPLFEYFLYPALRRCGLLTKPLKKMALGGFLAAASFVAAALIEVMIERELPGALAANQSHVTFVNGANCQLDIVNAHFKSHLEPFGTFAKEINLNVDSLDFNITATCKGSEAQTIAYNATLSSQNYTLVYIVLDETNTPTLDILEYDHEIQKPHSGGADVRILYNLQLLSPVPDGPFILRDKFTNAEVRRGNEVRGMSFPVEIDPTKGDIELILPNGREFETLDLKQGAAYLIVIGNDHEKLIATTHVIVSPNSVSMFWQAIPYLIITSGEIMFSITGLEFSYSQAPASMKSVLQAAWLLTVAFGNFVVVIIAKLALFNKQSYEFLFFAALMALDMLIFAAMAYFYVYVDPNAEEKAAPLEGKHPKQEESENGNDKSPGKAFQNQGFKEDTTQL